MGCLLADGPVSRRAGDAAVTPYCRFKRAEFHEVNRTSTRPEGSVPRLQEHPLGLLQVLVLVQVLVLDLFARHALRSKLLLYAPD